MLKIRQDRTQKHKSKVNTNIFEFFEAGWLLPYTNQSIYTPPEN